MTITIIFLILVSYLIGSVPFGILIGSRLYGINIRTRGSGNIGATNVFRVIGFKAGLTVLFADIFKGFIAVKIVQVTVGSMAGSGGSDLLPAIELAAAVAVVLGHTLSPFLGFSGGKGVATAAGAIAAMMPVILIILVLFWLVIVVFTKYVSIASIGAAALFPLLTFVTGQNPYRKILSVLIFAAILITHKSNIQRLIAGEENKFKLVNK